MKSARFAVRFGLEVIRDNGRSLWLAVLDGMLKIGLPMVLVMGTFLLAFGGKPLAVALVCLSTAFGTVVSGLVGFMWGAYEVRYPVTVSAPGSRLIILLRFVFPRRAFEEIFAQTVVDGREEYFAALADDRPQLARLRLMQMYLALIFAATTWAGVSVVGKIVRIWQIGR
ncbi:hypothetical protein [Mesorhizobium sp. M0207]|uniref:hypothetical protein n=1 Tax=Mesorhizobium sp. M0207 TaxID=2956915 RepID=UPI003334BBC5